MGIINNNNNMISEIKKEVKKKTKTTQKITIFAKIKKNKTKNPIEKTQEVIKNLY